jgi:hypothetical protein
VDERAAAGGRSSPLTTVALTQNLADDGLAGPPLGRRALPARSSLLVVLGVMLRGLVAVMGRMQFMRMRHVGVMARLLMIARFVVLGGFTMVVRGSLVMLGRELVMAATLVRLRAHVALLSLWSIDGGETATSI